MDASPISTLRPLKKGRQKPNEHWIFNGTKNQKGGDKRRFLYYSNIFFLICQRFYLFFFFAIWSFFRLWGRIGLQAPKTGGLVRLVSMALVGGLVVFRRSRRGARSCGSLNLCVYQCGVTGWWIVGAWRIGSFLCGLYICVFVSICRYVWVS